MIRRPALLPCLLFLLFGASGLAAQPSLAGSYRAGGPDTASMIELTEDGRFRYQLSEGALDEYAEGRWTPTTTGAELETQPHPTPPQFSLAPIGTATEGAGFTLQVRFAGQEDAQDGIPGVDFRIGFANGDVAEGYTQRYGWSMAGNDPRRPAWIEVYEPINGIASPRFDLPERAGMAVTLILTPNDVGVAAFNHTPVTLEGDALILHWRGGQIRYARMKPQDRAQDE